MLLTKPEERKQLKPGLYPALVNSIYELGSQYNNHFQNWSKKIWIEFAILDGKDTHLAGKRYTASLASRSDLTKTVSSLLGRKDFTEVDLNELIGKYCTVTVMQDGDYINIESVAPKSVEFPPADPSNGVVSLEDIANGTVDVPQFIATAVSKSKEVTEA